MVALAIERTFWEKATLLHAEAHRDPSKKMPPRYARHYHDLARMATEPVAEPVAASRKGWAIAAALLLQGWLDANTALFET
mgnify:CR=1 FL=1